MAGTGSGGGTSFENMSHEQMLAWLDQANSGEVQAAATRLTAAAKEIRKIAEELKVRPQWVEWKGEGADAFRAWANDLANSTHRLGDFSENSGKWLSEASNAIATAQASIPRDTKSAHANLVAATAAHNDPDAAAIRTKSAAELAALKADQEKVRLEAAAQMRKLGQSYEHSATQMNALPRPKFPPPPTVIRPPSDSTSENLVRPGSGTETTSTGFSGGGGSGSAAVGGSGATRPGHHNAFVSSEGHSRVQGGALSLPERDASGHLRMPVPAPETHVGVDSVVPLPDTHQRPLTGPASVPPPATRPELGPVLPTSPPIPPMAGGIARLPSTSGQGGRQFSEGRVPGRTGPGPVGSAPSRGVTGVSPPPGRNLPTAGGAAGRPVPAGQQSAYGRGASSGSGITGGRPSPMTGSGRPAGRASGRALGGESTGGRDSTGRAPIAGQPTARATGPTTRRAMPSARDGIVGGNQQRPGRAPARPGAPLPTAPTRGGIAGGVPKESEREKLRNASGASTKGARKRRDKPDGDRRREEPTTD